MDRRKFLTTNAALLGATFLANWGTRAQIRAYAQPGKPLLTERNLNRFFEDAHRNGELAAHARRARTDLGSFLRANFSLSPQQEQTLARMSPAERSQLEALLSDAASGKGKLTFKFQNAAPGAARAAECQTIIQIATPQGVRSAAVMAR